MTSRVLARWTFCYMFPATLIFSALCMIAIPFVSGETAIGIGAGFRSAIRPFLYLAFGGMIWFGCGPIVRTAVEKRRSRRFCETAYETLYGAMAADPIGMLKTKQLAILQEALKRELTRHCSKYPEEVRRHNIQRYQCYLSKLIEIIRTPDK